MGDGEKYTSCGITALIHRSVEQALIAQRAIQKLLTIERGKAMSDKEARREGNSFRAAPAGVDAGRAQTKVVEDACRQGQITERLEALASESRELHLAIEALGQRVVDVLVEEHDGPIDPRRAIEDAAVPTVEGLAPLAMELDLQVASIRKAKRMIRDLINSCEL